MTFYQIKLVEPLYKFDICHFRDYEILNKYGTIISKISKAPLWENLVWLVLGVFKNCDGRTQKRAASKAFDQPNGEKFASEKPSKKTKKNENGIQGCALGQHQRTHGPPKHS